MALATYNYKIDWDNDGNFTGPEDDFSSRVFGAKWGLGRNFASQLTGRAVAGTAEFLVRNTDGKFNRFLGSSPIFGKVLPRRPVKIEMTNGAKTTMWKGFLSKIELQPDLGGGHTAKIKCVGPLGVISRRKVNIPIQIDMLTGTIFAAVLDDIGWPAGDRLIDVGRTTLPFFWTGGKINALTALQRVTDNELGFYRETKDGKLALEDRHHRLFAPHTVSQATYQDADAPGVIRFGKVTPLDSLKDVYNIFTARVKDYTDSANGVIWADPFANTSGAAPSIPAGGSKDFFAEIPGSATPMNAKAVRTWDTPVAGSDFLANSNPNGSETDLTSDISVAVTKFDKAMKITLTNNHATQVAFIVKLQAKGVLLLESDPLPVKQEDSSSQTDYGERDFPFPGEFLPSRAVAEDYLGYGLSQYKDPNPIFSLQVLGNGDSAHLDEVRLRDVSDRITLKLDGQTKLGIDGDFFVESVFHQVDEARTHRMTLSVSQAQFTDDFLVWGAGRWNQKSWGY